MTIYKKISIFLLGGGISLLLYLISIRVYTIIFPKGVLFFGGCVISMLVSLFAMIVLRIVFNKIFDPFNLIMMYLSCTLLLIVFTIMGPTFIDRSISYHIVFYAAEEGAVDIEKMEQEFSKEIFTKRIQDELNAGMIKADENGTYVPTMKAKISAKLLIPLGKITNTLNTYEELKERLKNDTKEDTWDEMLDERK